MVLIVLLTKVLNLNNEHPEFTRIQPFFNKTKYQKHATDTNMSLSII